ncbi:hypothetical protein E2C01_075065 [Portunus trituberculatus]|uniref:Uncharacterized protein n=1 Tax=Portunus trituberculatus TaxID=210409 RepID=A0A5B7IE21_PORTR|nr:hypothetical protein [Portunus trituberculatus]
MTPLASHSCPTPTYSQICHFFHSLTSSQSLPNTPPNMTTPFLYPSHYSHTLHLSPSAPPHPRKVTHAAQTPIKCAARGSRRQASLNKTKDAQDMVLVVVVVVVVVVVEH